MNRPKESHRKFISFIKKCSLENSLSVLKHVIQAENIHERRFWIVILFIAMFGTGYCVLEVWKIYTSSFTKTTIMSTSHPYAFVPFPSVTLCETSRVHAPVLEQLFQKAAGKPGSYDEAVANLMLLLSTHRLPLFSEFKRMKKWIAHTEKLNKLNISDMLLKAHRTCEEIFYSNYAECWWRNNFYNCCNLFELQKTAYGYCYSFNSDVSEYSRQKTQTYGMYGDERDYWEDDDGVPRPKRTGGNDEWSALRVSLDAQRIPSVVNAKSGVMVMVRDPSALPEDLGLMIAKGTSGHIKIWGDRVMPTRRLMRVKPEKRQCLYPGEHRYLGRGYLRLNCITDCYQRFMYYFCGCVPGFNYFPYDQGFTYPECNFEGLICLAEYSANFVNIVGQDKNISSDLVCECPGDCSSQKYKSKIVVGNDTFVANQIIVDVHFQRSTCFLYETDIVFDFMNALVAYGGVCGLFLGASLISGVEFVHFLTFRIYDYWVNHRYTNKIFQRFIN